MSDNWSNATMTYREDLTEDLAIFRYVPDDPIPDWTPGQFVQIGLPYGSPHLHPEHLKEFKDPDKVLKRAYSIASPPKNKEYYEIYIALVVDGELTPRIWKAKVGDRAWVSKKAVGHFGMEHVANDRDVIMVCTGTGLAPFLSMALTYEHTFDQRKFTLIHRVRRPQDVAYKGLLSRLSEQHPNFIYIPTVTRNVPEDNWTQETQRIPELFSTGRLEEIIGGPVSADLQDIMMCGNPDMINDMNVVFEERGYKKHTRKEAGNLCFEKYW